AIPSHNPTPRPNGITHHTLSIATHPTRQREPTPSTFRPHARTHLHRTTRPDTVPHVPPPPRPPPPAGVPPPAPRPPRPPRPHPRRRRGQQDRHLHGRHRKGDPRAQTREASATRQKPSQTTQDLHPDHQQPHHPHPLHHQLNVRRLTTRQPLPQAHQHGTPSG